jgi:DNA repair protein RadC
MNEQTFFPFCSCDEPAPSSRRARVGLACEDTIEIIERPRVRGPLLNKPELVAQYLAADLAWRPSQEKFFVIPVDRKNKSLGKYLLSLGTLTSTCAAPREVYRIAIATAAAAVICAHNHPSGDPAPSAADAQLTRQLREAARAIDIELVDHVILGDAAADPRGVGFYSFRQAGVI